MWLPNQAAMQTWWMRQNQETWKTYMQVLYSMVNEWQGAWLNNYWVFDYMSVMYFTGPSSINQYLTINNPITD
jgi:hypothetical protein